jgi:DNA-binding protein YbaB
MNINPLEFMKNMQDMQSKMGDIQEKLKDVSSKGSAGGGLVEITMNGKFR